MRTAILNFNGGKYTGKIDARADTDKYASGCRELQNMIPKIHGGATRRPGTELINTKDMFNTVLSAIVANDEIVICLDNEVVVTNYNTMLSQITCCGEDVMCIDNEVVSDVNMAFLGRAVCYNDDLIFYDGDVVYI